MRSLSVSPPTKQFHPQAPTPYPPSQTGKLVPPWNHPFLDPSLSVPMICEQSPTPPLPDYGHGSGPPTWGPALLHAAVPCFKLTSYSQHLHLTGPTFCNGSCTPSCSHAAPPPHGNAPYLCVAWNCHFISFRALLIFSLCLSDCLSPIPSSDSPPG